VSSTGAPLRAHPSGSKQAQPPPIGYALTVPDRPNGPVVTFLLRRAAAGAGLLAAGSLALSKRAETPGGKAAALGMLAPGAGYVYSRNPGRLAVTIPAFGASLVTWFGSGNVIFPPAIWAAAALDARRQASRDRKRWDAATTAVPLALALAAGAGLTARRRAFRAAQERGRRRAAYLATTPRIEALPKERDQRELTEEDLSSVRGLLDRALQPPEQFAGYDDIEQFQGSAIRYQLFFQQWALAMMQMYHTPAFQGYLSAAQRNLIDKCTLQKVWGYWRWEQAWGNLSLNCDPMIRDNIMLSGYLGTCIGVYESNTGDQRYRHPGSLTFKLGSRAWPYDFGKIAEAIYRNMKRSRFTLFSCEPNWIYNMCNMTGINTLILSDRLLGTDYVQRIGSEFHRKLADEFITPDGRITAIRSARLGLTIPMLTSITADCSVIPLQHPSDPDLAGRTWAIVRREFVDTSTQDPTLVARGWDYLDYGNYRPGKFLAKAELLWTAAEMGDRELYDQLKASMDREYQPTLVDGVRWYPTGSTIANFQASLARFSPPGGYRELVRGGPGQAVRTGPYLEGAAYPGVLVARATTDGSNLQLVLRPGERGGRQTLGIVRLKPGRRYRISGAVESDLVADRDGRGWIDVDLPGRIEVAVAPAV
jgi:Linalool dehydratase/isomerase